MSNKLEQLEFIMEKIIGIEKHAGKVTKDYFFSGLFFLFWKCLHNLRIPRSR